VSVDRNKELIRRFYEDAWNGGKLGIIDELFADDYVLRHDLRPTQASPGPAGMKRITEQFRAAFPDLRFTVELIVGEGDYVVGRWSATGTHTRRWGDVEATGKAASFSGVNIFRFEKGKVAELWDYRDDLGLEIG
jgi:steroid delta-isomerase-like uncharacterized protein